MWWGPQPRHHNHHMRMRGLLEIALEDQIRTDCIYWTFILDFEISKP
jgi:hypothetical protein